MHHVTQVVEGNEVEAVCTCSIGADHEDFDAHINEPDTLAEFYGDN
jgi:hypothetical protein